MNEKIIIISAPNPDRHAGIAAKNIYELFKSKGHLVKIVSKEKNYNNPDFISIKQKQKSLFEKLKNKIFNSKIFKPEYHFISKGKKRILNEKEFIDAIPFKPDLMIVIFPHNFVTIKDLQKIQNELSTKIIWQLVDMSSFTGGCHYSWNCVRFRDECSSCPAVLKGKFKKIPLLNLRENYEITKKMDISISIGSDWLLNHAKSSLLFRDKKIIKNYLYVDKSIFTPKNEKDKKIFKENLGIPKEDFVIAFGAFSLNDKRKGIKFIIEALKLLEKHDDITLLIAGRGSEKLMNEFLDFKIVSLGDITRDFLPNFYYAANVFLNASLQDVGPYMLLESLFCNTPVISFNTGFANEFIVNKNIKYLIDDFSPKSILESLTAAYRYFKEAQELNVPDLNEIRKKVDQEIIYKNYMDLIYGE